MQALRNSVYLIVAIASIAMAAWQPPDRFNEPSAQALDIVSSKLAYQADIHAVAGRSAEGGQGR